MQRGFVWKLAMTALAFISGLALTTVWIFRTEMRERALDYSFSDRPAEDRVPNSETIKAGGYRLRPLSNDPVRVLISGMQVNSVDSQGVHVTFVLANAGGDQSYPHLRVTMLDASNRSVRSLVIDPAGYKHGQRMSRETISLTVVPRAGEQGLKIDPVYPEAEAAG
jgi:hypothetical protein